jgi:lipopolysaccharide export system permease protein
LRILDRYLAGAVIGGTLLTLAVLLPLLAFFILADEMDAVGTNDYSLARAMLFVAMTLPRYTYQLFPIATLIGALVGLGTLAGRSELVAMRAAGFAISRIVLGAMIGGLALAVVAVALGEGLAPAAEQRALALRELAQTGDVMQVTDYGLWARDGDTFVNIRHVEPGALLRDIYIYRVDGTELRSATHARAATYRDGGWVLQDIQRSLITRDGVQVEHIDETGWNSLLNPRRSAGCARRSLSFASPSSRATARRTPNT